METNLRNGSKREVSPFLVRSKRLVLLLLSFFLLFVVYDSIAKSQDNRRWERMQQRRNLAKTVKTRSEGGTESTISTVTMEDGALSAVVNIVGDAGQLSTLITEALRPQIKKLTVSGEINGPDLLLIRQMCGSLTEEEEEQGITIPFNGQLSILDMTKASLVGGYYDVANLYSVDIDGIGIDMFRKCLLEAIYLPEKLEWLASSAFEECKESLEIHFTGPKAPECGFPWEAHFNIYVPGDCQEVYRAKFAEYVDDNIITIYTGPDFGAVNDDVYVATAGQLYSMLQNPEKTLTLKVRGYVNEGDMYNLANLVDDFFLSKLDLSEATFVDRNGSTIDRLETEIPWEFFDLKQFVLPNSVKELGEEAMAIICFVPNFEVTENNPNFKYVDDILYSADGKKLVLMRNDIRKEVLDIPEGTETIGFYALHARDVGIVNCPSSLRSIENWAFASCRAKNIDLNDGLLTLGDYCFESMRQLLSIEIPEGVTQIPQSAFSWCGNLIKVVLPSTISHIGNSAFKRCNNLKAIEIKAYNVPKTETYSFDGLNVENVTLYVLSGMKSLYNNNESWSIFTNVEEGSAGRLGIAENEVAILKKLFESTDGENWITKWEVDWNQDIMGLDNVNVGAKDDGFLHVTSIDLSNNNMTGNLPVELFDLPYLEWLDLASNNLTGDIGTLFEGRTPKSENLEWISLGNNQLSGDLYPFVAALQRLTYLHVTSIDLSNNNMTGNLPVELFDLPYLEWLDLASNNLTGDIGTLFEGRTPKSENLEWISLGNNQLSGDLYPFVAALQRLTYLYIEKNCLTGMSAPLPETLSVFVGFDQFADKKDTAPVIDNVKLSSVKLSDFTQAFCTYNHMTRTFESPASCAVLNYNEEHDYYDTVLEIKEDGVEIRSDIPVKKGDLLTLRIEAKDYFVSSYYRLKADFDIGDANFDGTVDVADLQLAISKILGQYSASTFFLGAADSYPDGILNVQDLVVTANIILDSPVNATSYAKAANGEMERNWMVASSMGVSVELVDSVGILDFFLSGIDENDIALALPSSEWKMMKKQSDGGVRAIVFSPVGAYMGKGVSEVIKVDGGVANAKVIKAVSPTANTVTIGTRGTTTVGSLDAGGDMMDIYDYSGRLIKSNAKNVDGLKPGTYILYDKANNTKKKLNITKR